MKKYIIPTILAIVIISIIIRWSNNGTLDNFGEKLSEIKQNITFDFKEASNEIKDKVITKTIKSSCPQINVSMEGNIKDKTYDGWAVKGDATCRKGTKEGENLNNYYCGGYKKDIFGIPEVNAYIMKTSISNEGDIGKTYKYVIWNTYDENKNFIRTECLGDPDKLEREIDEALEREMLKWNQ